MEMAKENRGNWRHGLHGTPTYRSWHTMKTRCKAGGCYAMLGVRVCQRWETFENFLEDMGIRPEGTTLDRIVTDGHYEPDNCRWATAETQRNNLRKSVFLTFDGQTMTAAQWEKHLSLPRSTVTNRLRGGWSIERTLTTPSASSSLQT